MTGLRASRNLQVMILQSYIECYHFYQQYVDHFATIKATSLNYILFAAFFFSIDSVSASTNTHSGKTKFKKTCLIYLSPSSKLSCKTVWGTLSYLIILFEVELEKIPNISIRKFRIILPILSISNLFLLNLILTKLLKTLFSFVYFERGSST